MPVIRKLVMKNFKSFKSAELIFDSNLVAIIGPNGSGKSNIVDALSFVLGRISAKSLRANKLAELIFNGGKSSNGADYAEVTIEIDNRDRRIPIDSDIVRITRRVNRKGDVKYLINGRRTTRSDILDLIGGIASPDGYSIVMQGELARFVRMSPIERREIVDDLAGIREFDEKKEKALQELAKVEENIEHARIILGEIERNLSRLEEEKKRAERYLELERALRELRARIYKTKLELARRKMNSVLDEKRRVEIALEEKRSKLNDLESKISELERRKREIEDRIMEKSRSPESQRIRELEKEIERLKARIESLDSEREKLERSLQRKIRRKEELEKALDQLCRKEESLLKQIEGTQKVEEKLSAKLREIQRKIESLSSESDSLAARRSEIERKLLEARSSLKEKRIELEKILESLEELGRNLEIKERRRDNLLSEKRDLEARVEEIRSRLSEADSKSVKSAIKVYDLYKERSKLLEELKKVEREIKDVEREISRLEARISARKNAEEEYLGFGEGAAAVLKARDSGLLKGILGTVAQLARPIDPQFAVALEVAAGNRLSYVVTETEDDAIAAIRYLKENKIGRATFLPLNRIKPKPPREEVIELLGKPGVIGLAVDLLEYEPRLEPVFLYVYSDTIVVDSLEVAKKIGIGKGLRMVTLDGQLIEPGGAMVGGFYQKKRVGGFSTNEEENKLADLRARLERLEKKRSEIVGRLEELYDRIESLEMNRAKAGDEIERLRSELSSKETKLRMVEGELENLEKEIDEIRKKLEEKSSRRKSLEGEIGNLESRIRELEFELEKLASSSGSLQKLYEEYNSINSKLLSVRSELERLRSDALNLSREKREKESLLSEIVEEIETARRDLELLENERMRIGSQIGALSSQLEELKEKEEEASREIIELRAEHSRIQREIDHKKDMRRHVILEITNLDSKLGDLKVKIARIEDEINRWMEKLDELGISEDSVQSLGQDDLGRASEEIERLEKELRELGDVNLKAIEDYEELRRRRDSFVEKLEKLKEEKESCLKLIEEIESKKKQKFMETFRELSKAFSEIFSKIYDGEARLILENEEDPFSGGLSIEVKPRGHKVTSLEALSGGEKSLVSLAFIFAVQRLRPSSFYVLDEVDANLDIENAERVANLIRELSRKTQFIVISHRPPIRNVADRIYGVHMGEDGSSKLVSLARV